MEITKTEESLKAADLCYAQGLYNSSASRAYYAMFQGVQVALEAVAFARLEWSHAGLHATFANELTTSARDRLFVPSTKRGNSSMPSRKESSMAEPLSYTQRRLMIDKCLTEISLFAKEHCPTAKVEATLTCYEDEDGHVRIYPPACLTDSQIEELEGQVASRCVDLLIETGIFLCAAVYAPDL